MIDTEFTFTESWRQCASVSAWEVSNCGNVRNRSTKRRLKQRPTHDGYLRCHAYPNRQLLVHRLVADAYLPGYRAGLAAGLELDHINGDVADNRITNLRLITHRANVARSQGKPVAINGTVYPSLASAAESIGKSRTVVRRYIRDELASAGPEYRMYVSDGEACAIE